MPRVIVHGFYGMGNLGDEAILTALLRECSKLRDIKVTVLSPNPATVRAAYHLPALRAGGRLSQLRLTPSIAHCDLFLLGGGGLLKDYGDSPASLLSWLKPIALAQRLGKRTATFAIGADHVRFPRSKNRLRQVLSRADMIAVRDSFSADLLRLLGVTGEIDISSDPALLLTHEGTWRGMDEARVAICVRHWFSDRNATENSTVFHHFLSALASTVRALRSAGASIDFIPMRANEPDDDRAIAHRIWQMAGRHGDVRVFESVPRVESFIERLPRYRLLIGMRLHSLILATGVGVPVVGLDYMPKVGAFMRSVGESDRCLRLEETYPDRLSKLVMSVYNNPRPRTQGMSQNIPRLRVRSQRSIAAILALSGAARA